MKKRRTVIVLMLIVGMVALLSAAGCASSGLSLSENFGQYERDQDDNTVEPEESSYQNNNDAEQQERPVQSVYNLREYVFPMGDVPVFSVMQQNYYQNMPVISYEVFDCEELLLHRLSADVSLEERDTDNDGYTDELRETGETVRWVFRDENRDGSFDVCVAIESNFDSTVDFKIQWNDRDYNGTMDEVTVYITNTDDLGKGVFSTQYLYGDFSDIDFDTGKADYTNQNKVQFIQAVTLPENSPFDEQQLFRDLNGDGKIDWMQTRKYYDTNDDGVKESTKISNDRDMDGVFEDEFVFDGKILENSLIY